MTFTDTAPTTSTEVRTAAPTTDLGLLVLRVVMGIVMFLHGWQKFFTNGTDGVEQMLTGAGVPMPGITAIALPALELVGGALLVLGVATRVLGVLFTLSMIGAIIWIHGAAGFFAAGGGYEFVLVLAAIGVTLALTGGGRFSVDNAFVARRR